MPKQFLFAAFIALLFSLTLFAQNQNEKPVALLVDEFDNYEQVSSVIARLENLAVQVQNQPDSRAYIVVYRHRAELPGKTERALEWAKLYLMANRGLEAERIVLVNGGVVSCPATQLWLVPNGATPKIKENLYRQVFEDTEAARKFDEYYFSFGKIYIDIDTAYGRIYVDSLNAFTSEVKKEKDATAYVIVYPEYEGRYIGKGDPPHTAMRMSRKIRGDLINKYKLAASKIRIVNGGYRRLRQVELWILPGGAHPPVATPNAFPKIGGKAKNNKRLKK